MEKFNIINYVLFVFLAYLANGVKSQIIINCFDKHHCKVCQTIMRNCILSGTTDISKCVSCEEKRYKVLPCTQSPQTFLMEKRESRAFVQLKQNDLGDGGLKRLINEIVQISTKRIKRDLTNENLNEVLKNKIKQLCKYTNFNDKYENAKAHKQASVIEIQQHIQEIIESFMHGKDSMEHIHALLSNPALCLKDPSEWTKDRTGFKEVDVPSAGVLTEKSLFKGYKISKLFYSLKSSFSNCNKTFCDRFSDENECEHNIRVLNQGKCGNCWAFASSTVISAYRCRKGLGFAEPSIKYATLCKNKYTGYNAPAKQNVDINICNDGGHLIYYLWSMEKTGMLPTSHDMPYDKPLSRIKCPANNPSWSNIWENVKLINRRRGLYLYRGFLKISFNEYAESNNINELINILKEYIIEQGAVFVSMKVRHKISFDHNGERVMMNCEWDSDPDHALVLIGYGDYLKPSGEKSSYWLIRNSWGREWGHKGNFKVDMYGPPGCNGNVLHNAFPIFLEMKGRKINVPLPDDIASTDVKTSYDPSRFGPSSRNNIIPRNRINPARFNDADPYSKPTQKRNSDKVDPPKKPSNGQYRRPNHRPYSKYDYLFPHNNKKDMSDIINNSHSKNLRKLFRADLVTEINGITYKRTIFSQRKEEHQEKYSCLRTFSIESDFDSICHQNCENFIDKCKYKDSIGKCLRRYAPNYRCIYCGM